jgi:hypothetical protein
MFDAGKSRAGKRFDSLAPWLPFRLPRMNLPSAFMTKTPTPILGSLLEVMVEEFLVL